MRQEALQKIGERAEVRGLLAVTRLPKAARNVAPETGVNTNAKGQAKGRDAPGNVAVWVEAVGVITEQCGLEISRHEIDSDAVPRLYGCTVR